MIYADNAATTKMSEAAIQTMTALFHEAWGNPSSLYGHGQEAKEVLEKAREEIAAVIGAQPQEILFTSGGSEADNQTIRSAAALGAKKGKRHIVSTAFEHHAVLHTLKKLEEEGFEVTLLPVHENGIVRPEEVAAAIREDTCLVTVMFANNEIGTIQPIREIGAICRDTPANLTRCFEIGCKCHPYWWNYAHIPWVEGAAGNGIGESVSVEFTKEMAGMSVLNGYTSLDKLKLYKENARVKEISLEDLINGDKWTVTFDDYVYFNYIEFPKKTTKIKMTINSVYEGTKYQDTCVSAILPSPESPRSYADSDYEDFKEMIKSCEEVLPEDLLSISPY